MEEGNLQFQSMNLNISYDAPQEVWSKLRSVYEKLDGWIEDTSNEVPYWFGFAEDQKHICASVEPSGLHFAGLMPDQEWDAWRKRLKAIATEILGYKVGEVEEGEVDY